MSVARAFKVCVVQVLVFKMEGDTVNLPSNKKKTNFRAMRINKSYINKNSEVWCNDHFVLIARKVILDILSLLKTRQLPTSNCGKCKMKLSFI
jgi:hypothetical protein